MRMWAAEVALEPGGGGERGGDGKNGWGDVLGNGGWERIAFAVVLV